MKAPKVRFQQTLDVLSVEDGSWVTLGALRALVEEADARGWADSALVSHDGYGDPHPTRRDAHITRRLLVEGDDPGVIPDGDGPTL